MHSETGSGRSITDTQGGSNNPLLPATRQPSNSQCVAWTLPPISERLVPVGVKEGTAELMACLTLVAPTGMSSDERAQWVHVARQTLTGIPADLMKRGARAARAKCRFPSEIVPAIMAEIADEWQRRRRTAAEEGKPQPKFLPKPDRVSPEEARKIMAEYGLTMGSENNAS